MRCVITFLLFCSKGGGGGWGGGGLQLVTNPPPPPSVDIVYNANDFETYKNQGIKITIQMYNIPVLMLIIQSTKAAWRINPIPRPNPRERLPEIDFLITIFCSIGIIRMTCFNLF